MEEEKSKKEKKLEDNNIQDEKVMKANHERSGHSTASKDYLLVFKYMYLHI